MLIEELLAGKGEEENKVTNQVRIMSTAHGN